jgi:hypothetical protein
MSSKQLLTALACVYSLAIVYLTMHEVASDEVVEFRVALASAADWSPFAGDKSMPVLTTSSRHSEREVKTIRDILNSTFRYHGVASVRGDCVVLANAGDPLTHLAAVRAARGVFALNWAPLPPAIRAEVTHVLTNRKNMQCSHWPPFMCHSNYSRPADVIVEAEFAPEVDELAALTNGTIPSQHRWHMLAPAFRRLVNADVLQSREFVASTGYLAIVAALDICSGTVSPLGFGEPGGRDAWKIHAFELERSTLADLAAFTDNRLRLPPSRPT